MSAPLKPGESYASLLEMDSMFWSGLIFRGARWTLKIYYLALTSGRVISTILSNLPGRVSALSSVYLRLVAASTTTVSLLVKPSISTNNWLRVESFYSFLELYLFLPIASISSMKIIDGACYRAFAKS
jgi:hypothetical protein